MIKIKRIINFKSKTVTFMYINSVYIIKTIIKRYENCIYMQVKTLKFSCLFQLV